jgi:hypothetical protein
MKKHLVRCSKTHSYIKVKTATPLSGGSEAASGPSTSAMVPQFKISKSCNFYTKYASTSEAKGRSFNIKRSTYCPPKQTD